MNNSTTFQLPLWLVISIIISFTSIQTSTSQIIWQSVNALNRDVQYISDKSIVIVGDHGKIIRSDDDGEKWKWLESYTRPNFHSVHFIDPSIGCVAGDSGIVVFTTNGGASWTKTNVGVNIPLRGVQMLTTNTAVCVGDSGSMYRTVDRGQSWTRLTSGTIYNLNSVSFTNNNFGVAVGDNGTVLRTENGGASWTSTIIKPLAVCMSVRFINDKFGMICGQISTGFEFGKAGLIYRTSDGGSTWTMMDSSISYRPYNLSFIDSAHIFVASSPTVVRKSSDGGITWMNDQIDFTYFTKPFLSVVDMFGVSFLPNGKGCLIGEKGFIAMSKDSGSTWDFHSFNQVQVEDIFDKSLNDVVMTDGDNGVFLGSDDYIFQTYDGGVTSIRRTPITSVKPPGVPPGAFWAGAHFTSKTDGIALGYDGYTQNRVARTSDGGETWKFSTEFKCTNMNFSNEVV